MTADLAAPAPRPSAVASTRRRAGVRPAPTPSDDYRRPSSAAKEAIRAGEALPDRRQPALRACATDADPLDVYRVLRVDQPEPVHVPAALRRLRRRRLVARRRSSRSSDGRAMLHPIAGTRWRGATPEEDAALAAELLADPKERAEHLMLVDLGRNDLGRVCAPGTVEVADFMTVERYSHVMHIVSTVVGRARATAAPRSTCWPRRFPAGTLSGAPKLRAMEIIEELEPTRRGLYGGVRRLPRLRRRPRHRDRDPHRLPARRRRLRPGRRRHRRRLRPGGRGHRVPQQGDGGAAGGRHGGDAAAAGMSARTRRGRGRCRAGGGVLLLVAEPGVGLVAVAGTGAALLLQPRPRRAMAAVLAVVGAGDRGRRCGIGRLAARCGWRAAGRCGRRSRPSGRSGGRRRAGRPGRARPPASAQRERSRRPRARGLAGATPGPLWTGARTQTA